MRFSVLIVEEQNIPRHYFESEIRNSEKFIHIGSSRKTENILSFCQNKKPDIILTDLLFETCAAGFELIENVKREYPEIKIIAVTDMPESTWPERAKECGADSFWYMNNEKSNLLSVMEKTCEGEKIFPDGVPSVKFGFISSDELTSREIEVLRELLTGESNESIAEHLGISPDTVKFHLKSMFQKTGFRTRTELAVEARAKGIVIKD